MRETNQNLLNSILQVVSGEEEQIDELKLKTLKSYQKKAEKSLDKIMSRDTYDRRVVQKRIQGIEDAKGGIKAMHHTYEILDRNLKYMKDHNKNLKKIEGKEKISSQQIQDMIKALETDVREFKKGKIEWSEVTKRFTMAYEKLYDSVKIVGEHEKILTDIGREVGQFADKFGVGKHI